MPKPVKPLMQKTLFEVRKPWEKEWEGMPEFAQEKIESWKTLLVHFACVEDLQAFAELVGQKLTPQTKSIYYPEAEKRHIVGVLRYADESQPEPGRKA